MTARHLGRWTLRGVRRLTVVEWTLFHWYAFLGIVWGVLLLTYPPSGPAAALGALLDVVAYLMVFGASVGIVGAFLTKQPRTAGNVGLLVEAVGLGFLQAGNVSYLLSQIALATAPVVGRDRYALLAYVWAVSASLLVRGLFLVKNYRHVGESLARKVIH